MRHMNTPLTGILSVLIPLPFEVLLLALTMARALNSTTLSESHPSSPIVCLVFHFGFVLETNLCLLDASSNA
jgi:hypothetical protein